MNGGTLGGSGIIAAAVTVGMGSGRTAVLAPGAGTKQPVTLTLNSGVSFKSDAVYTHTLKARRGESASDQVIAKGVTIENGAQFDFRGKAHGTLVPSTSFTAISNTAATPISGAFANLPEGAIVDLNGNNLQASYEGGDGNDLTSPSSRRRLPCRLRSGCHRRL